MQVTPGSEEQERQSQAQRERLARLAPQQRARLERQIEEAERGQRIPILRLMKKTNLKGILIDSFNQHEKNRYTRN